jgi:hypothetical protein
MMTPRESIAMTTIPVDWLIGPATVQEVEDRLAEEGAPDLWLDQWRAFLDRAGPRDELWEYFAAAPEDSASESWETADVQEGYVFVRDGQIVDAISTLSLP